MMADEDLLNSNMDDDLLQNSKCSVVNMLDDPMNDEDLELRFDRGQLGIDR